jgi:NADH-quinone oxidoreductase subunit G
MVKIHVDGTTFDADATDNLLQACLSQGFDLPYFCWHPALGSLGACRQCAVKVYRDENDKVGRLVMACMTPCNDNTRLSIADKDAREFREAIIAMLMTNHPHDCPVCEEGGHCHLQDMTVMTGHHKRTYHFTKRTHLNQELGPFIAHEMNRCIACYRCVRFYNDYAGGTDLGVFGTAANVYFGRARSGTLENEFSGNLTEVCPTGVFTDKTHSERYVRKWDMQFAPSICAGCAVGCNISPGERYGEVRRIENRYHGELNGYFLCDRGRFGYGYVNRKDRPRKPMVKRGGVLEVVDTEDAIAAAHALLRSGRQILGIGSPRASVEANIALRGLVGRERFSDGTSVRDHELVRTVLGVLREGPVGAASIRDMESADAVLVLGEDVLATAPRVALALRQAARGKAIEMTRERKVPEFQAQSAADIAQRARNPVVIATAAATRIDDIATTTLRLGPDEVAALGHAIAHELDASVALPANASNPITDAARAIARILGAAKRPLVVSGCGAGHVGVIEAAANVAWALVGRNASTMLSLAVPEANSLAMAMLDAPPLEDALERIAGNNAVVVVLENDLERRVPRALLVRTLGESSLIVVDHQMNATAQNADVLLPSATFAEGDGTLVNMEGRAQRFFQTFDPAYYDRSIATAEAWRWLGRLRGGDATDENLDAVLAACEAHCPQFAGIADAAPGAKFRIRGMHLARAPSRQSGRTAARAVVFVHEPRSTPDEDTPLAFSMEGYNGIGSQDRPPELLPFAWAPGWNSPQAWNKFQTEVGGPLRGGDPGVMLIHPAKGRRAFFAAGTFQPDTLLHALPLWEHFGSEELTRLSSALAERVPTTYVVLSSGDARRFGIDPGTRIRVVVGDEELTAPVDVRSDFASMHVGLPVGLRGVPAFVPGTACNVSKAG